MHCPSADGLSFSRGCRGDAPQGGFRLLGAQGHAGDAYHGDRFSLGSSMMNVLCFWVWRLPAWNGRFIPGRSFPEFPVKKQGTLSGLYDGVRAPILPGD